MEQQEFTSAKEFSDHLVKTRGAKFNDVATFAAQCRTLQMGVQVAMSGVDTEVRMGTNEMVNMHVTNALALVLGFGEISDMAGILSAADQLYRLSVVEVSAIATIKTARTIIAKE